MNAQQKVIERAKRETQGRQKRKADPKKLAVAAVASMIFLAFIYGVLGQNSSRTHTGITVDALRHQSSNKYGLLTADGPAVETAALPNRMAVATPSPSKKTPIVNDTNLSEALASIRDLNNQVSSLHGEVSGLKAELATTQSELSVARTSFDQLERQYDQRELQFQGELAQAVADAEARILANTGQDTGLSAERRRHLEELRAQRKRQNESDGIVFDETPIRRSN